MEIISSESLLKKKKTLKKAFFGGAHHTLTHALNHMTPKKCHKHFVANNTWSVKHGVLLPTRDSKPTLSPVTWLLGLCHILPNCTFLFFFSCLWLPENPAASWNLLLQIRYNWWEVACTHTPQEKSPTQRIRSRITADLVLCWRWTCLLYSPDRYSLG